MTQLRTARFHESLLTGDATERPNKRTSGSERFFPANRPDANRIKEKNPEIHR